MATGTFYLRPSADVSLQHSVYPTTLSAGYLAINEEVCDELSTYVYAEGDPYDSVNSTQGKSSECASKFKLKQQGNAKIKRITNCACRCSMYSPDHTLWYGYEISFGNEVIYSKGRNENGDWYYRDGYFHEFDDEKDRNCWTTFEFLDSYNAPDYVDKINQFISENNELPEISVELYTRASGASNSKNDPQIVYISQIEFELTCEYESSIYTKQSGQWLQAQTAFQKQNGAWVEITEDECKEILQSVN